METSVWSDGQVQTEDFDTEFLGDRVKVRLLRHAVRMYQSNLRAGTHKTKSRGELHYRKAPLFKQKGTGRARVRHQAATQCRHGGIPHGPKPRDYSYHMPKKARLEALRSALLSKFRDGEVTLARSFSFPEPKTSRLAGILDDLGYAKSCLIIVAERDDNLLLSARNLRRVDVIPADDVNAFHLLHYRNVIITDDALASLRKRTDES
ncbi:MAG TPA: 50S ribosomal protein L4 [Planctomycetes bacterium]|nr:50S ribosomal protein L4 [Planctomycetota bacterium]